MSESEDAKWHSFAVRLVLGLTALRLAWHLVTPIGLLGDEAYYWEWGRRLDWGYFSKPPLIAWLFGLVGRLTGDSLYAFKATATLLTSGGLWFFYLALRTMFGAGLAFWALAAAALSVGNTLLASILTIDAPLLFFWCLALYLYFRLLYADGEPRWRDALLLTVALGLGHLSKQMMLAFLPLLFVGAWCGRRSLLRKPHLYVAALASLLFLIPPFLWNLSNDWITVAHTGHHFEPAGWQPGEIVVRYLTLAAVTALLLTPILFGLVLGAIWSMRHWARQPARLKVLFWFGPASLIGIGILALRQEINPNWPAVFYPAAIGLTTWWCLRGDAPRRAEWFRRSLALGATLTLALMVLLPFLDALGVPAQRRGWRGYPALAAALRAEVAELPPAQRSTLGPNIILDGHRFNASQLAYQYHDEGPAGNGPARVFLWPHPEKIDSQYDFWPGLQAGANALVLVERKNENKTGEPDENLATAFETLEPIGEIPLHHSRDFPTFKVYLGHNLKGWPQKAAQTTLP